MPTTLRRWQSEALELWTNRRRGVASVVTGAGKTIFALACVDAQRSAEPDLKVLIVVPTLALVDQWRSVLHQPPLRGPEDIALHRAGRIGRRSPTYHLATANTARGATRELTKQGNWMLVADECHRFASPANRSAIEGDWSATLGLSATPSREYDSWFEDFVVPTLGPVFYEYTYADALADDILTPFSLQNYRIPLTANEWERYSQLTRRIAKFSRRRSGADDEHLKRANLARARVAQQARMRLPAAQEIMKRHRGERSLIFHEQVSSAERLTTNLRAGGHRAVLYHSQMNASERLKSLLMFRTGQADVLVSCRALDEGIDVPDATFGLICSSTASARQRIQRMGRLVRASPGKAYATIGTLYATESEQIRLQDEEKRLEGLASVSWYEVRLD